MALTILTLIQIHQQFTLLELTLLLRGLCTSVPWLQQSTALIMQQHMVAKILNYFKIGLMMCLDFLHYVAKHAMKLQLLPQRVPCINTPKELVNLENLWDTIKIKLREIISECSNAVMAKHKLSNLKQSACAIYEYISKFSDLAEHAYQIKPGIGSHILASNFIEGIDNPYIRTKLRSNTGNTLDAFFAFAIQETEKQQIQALNFDQDKKTDVLEFPDIQVVQSQHKGCFKCNSVGHFAKDCPTNSLTNKVLISTISIQYLTQTDLTKHKNIHNEPN